MRTPTEETRIQPILLLALPGPRYPDIFDRRAIPASPAAVSHTRASICAHCTLAAAKAEGRTLAFVGVRAVRVRGERRLVHVCSRVLRQVCTYSRSRDTDELAKHAVSEGTRHLALHQVHLRLNDASPPRCYLKPSHDSHHEEETGSSKGVDRCCEGWAG